MDHQQAVNGQLPERYGFGDLAETERDQFEEHLADCSECLREVTLAQAFAANTKAVFRDEVRLTPGLSPVRAAPALQWLRTRIALAFSGGLNLALAGVALYAFLAIVPVLQQRIRTLDAPSVSESFVVQGVTRSAPPVYTVSHAGAANFRLDLPREFDRYVCVIEDVAKHSPKTYNLRLAGNGETLNLTVPVAELAAGDYNVRLTGVQGSDSELLASFRLHVLPAK